MELVDLPSDTLLAQFPQRFSGKEGQPVAGNILDGHLHPLRSLPGDVFLCDPGELSLCSLFNGQYWIAAVSEFLHLYPLAFLGLSSKGTGAIV